MTTIDWASLRKTAEDASRPLPEDWYDVVVTKAEATTASTGSEMIKVTLKVMGGPHDGRNLWTNLVLSPDSPFALQRFFASLTAFGVDPAQVAPGGSLDELAYALADRTARVKVGIRPWQGQERNEVNEMVPSGHAQVTSPGGGLGGPVVTSTPGGGVPSVPSTPSSSSSMPTTPETPAQNPGSAPPELPF